MLGVCSGGYYGGGGGGGGGTGQVRVAAYDLGFTRGLVQKHHLLSCPALKALVLSKHVVLNRKMR